MCMWLSQAPDGNWRCGRLRPTECGTGVVSTGNGIGQSSLILPFFTTSPHFASSFFKKAAKSAGVEPTG